MDHATIAVYDRRAREWEAARRGRPVDHVAAFARAADQAHPDGVRADLGCGPGWYTAALGSTVVAVDAVRAMLELVPRYAPSAWRVQADLAALPFRRGSIGAAFGSKSYVHLARMDIPLALADLHRCTAVDALVELVVFEGDMELGSFADDDFPGRRFSLWPEDRLRDVIEGAGFAVDSLETVASQGNGRQLLIRARRVRTLPDYVGPAMRMLVVGLNPSVYAADTGVGFARPGNRFWPAALSAGVVSRDRDPRHALLEHGVGMTDLVKRATARASELSRAEFRAGRQRVERLVEWLQPRVVCVLGVTGWRVAADAKATVGLQQTRLAGVPVYVMPNPSGLNARVPLSELADHLRRAIELDAPRSRA